MNSVSDRKTVLVVDDDTSVLLALEKRLTQAGYCVLTALNGVDALERARLCTVDAISLDVAMPGDVSGLDVADELRLDPSTAHIPIVFVTGTADEHFKERCSEVGGRYFLTKPYDAELLLQTLSSMLAADDLAEIKRISAAKRRQPIR